MLQLYLDFTIITITTITTITTTPFLFIDVQD
jgi:hypothetical protein